MTSHNFGVTVTEGGGGRIFRDTDSKWGNDDFPENVE